MLSLPKGEIEGVALGSLAEFITQFEDEKLLKDHLVYAESNVRSVDGNFERALKLGLSDARKNAKRSLELIVVYDRERLPDTLVIRVKERVKGQGDRIVREIWSYWKYGDFLLGNYQIDCDVIYDIVERVMEHPEDFHLVRKSEEDFY